MKTSSYSTFKYNFRTPGAQIEGPIQYAIGKTVLGRVLVGRSQRGICAIFLGDDEPALHKELTDAFPGVEMIAALSTLHREVNQVVAFIDKDTADGIIDLDIGGSPFQQKVWQMLCGIPAGQTRSYREVAEHMGVPEAVRAVAGACAANVLAIAIPCHRVVRSDGSISGYRWGIERKRTLLAEEAEL